MPRAPDFFSQMDRVELEKLEAYSREPGRTVDQVHEWMLAEGFTASRAAVGRWLKKFKERDGMSAAAEIADAIYTAHADSGAIDMTKAAQLQLAQRLVNRMAKNAEQDDVDYLHKSAITLESLSRTGRHNVKLEREVEELKREKAAAVRDAEAAVKSGASAVDVVATIKRSLGITA